MPDGRGWPDGRTDGKREGGTAHEKGERKKRTTQTQRWLNQEFFLANANNAAGDVFTGRAVLIKVVFFRVLKG